MQKLRVLFLEEGSLPEARSTPRENLHLSKGIQE